MYIGIMHTEYECSTINTLQDMARLKFLWQKNKHQDDHDENHDSFLLSQKNWDNIP